MRLTLLAMLPDIDAIRTMLPGILFATMSFATALAVMKEPGMDCQHHSLQIRICHILENIPTVLTRSMRSKSATGYSSVGIFC